MRQAGQIDFMSLFSLAQRIVGSAEDGIPFRPYIGLRGKTFFDLVPDDVRFFRRQEVAVDSVPGVAERRLFTPPGQRLVAPADHLVRIIAVLVRVAVAVHQRQRGEGIGDAFSRRLPEKRFRLPEGIRLWHMDIMITPQGILGTRLVRVHQHLHVRPRQFVDRFFDQELAVERRRIFDDNGLYQVNIQFENSIIAPGFVKFDIRILLRQGIGAVAISHHDAFVRHFQQGQPSKLAAGIFVTKRLAGLQVGFQVFGMVAGPIIDSRVAGTVIDVDCQTEPSFHQKKGILGAKYYQGLPQI